MRSLFLLAFVGALALGQNLEVQRLSPPGKIRPGDFTVQVWQIKNETSQALTVQIVPDLPQGWEALGLPESIPLGPGEEDYLFLALYVPRTAKAGVYQVRVFLRWDGNEVQAETHRGGGGGGRSGTWASFFPSRAAWRIFDLHPPGNETGETLWITSLWRCELPQAGRQGFLPQSFRWLQGRARKLG
jgi:hypothetical protein